MSALHARGPLHIQYNNVTGQSAKSGWWRRRPDLFSSLGCRNGSGSGSAARVARVPIGMPCLRFHDGFRTGAAYYRLPDDSCRSGQLLTSSRPSPKRRRHLGTGTLQEMHLRNASTDVSFTFGCTLRCAIGSGRQTLAQPERAACFQPCVSLRVHLSHLEWQKPGRSSRSPIKRDPRLFSDVTLSSGMH